MTKVFELKVEECACCKRPMMIKANNGLFPYYIGDNQESQMKKQGIVFSSHSKKNNQKICIECEKSGKASFVCALCHENRGSEEVEESFGDPAEYLCKECFSTVSAKVWEEKTDELSRAHRYDFE